MPKLPDFKDISNKFDFDSIMKNVKQMISPEEQMPHPDSGDKLGELIAQCSAMAHDLTREQEEMAKHSEELHIKLNQLFKALREDPKVKAEIAKAEAAKSAKAKTEASNSATNDEASPVKKKRK